jgi:phage replication O-like protein O
MYAIKQDTEYPGPRLVERRSEYKAGKVATGAEIQIEDGEYTRIHNMILESLSSAPLNGSEFRCLMFLMRKTYGWQKKDDKISLQQWEDGTGIKRQNVWATLKTLEAKKVIYSQDNGAGKSKTYGFNKYAEQWVMESECNAGALQTVMETQNTHVMQLHDGTVMQVHEYKREEIKEKEKETTPEASSRRHADVDVEFGKLCGFYQNNIGTMTEVTAQTLSDFVTDYGGYEIVTDAIRVAVQANKRNLRYINGILRNWHADGRNDGTAKQLQPVAQPSEIPAEIWGV